MNLSEILDLHDRCKQAVIRATSTWAPGMSPRLGCTRCPGCRNQSLHYTRTVSGEAEYRCESEVCVVNDLHRQAAQALGGRA